VYAQNAALKYCFFLKFKSDLLAKKASLLQNAAFLKAILDLI